MTDYASRAELMQKRAKLKKILAISSGGGHWVQLRRITPAFEGHRVIFATVNPDYYSDVDPATFYAVSDVTRWNRIKLLQTSLKILWIILYERPDIVVSTGALPGYIAIRIGKKLGCTTIWVDSIANVEELSLSGTRVGKYADLWLTQWSHLARADGPEYAGQVL